MDEKDLTYQLAQYVSDVDHSDIPREVIEWAKLRVLDVIGCILASAKASGIGPVLEYAKYMGGKSESTLLLGLQKAPAPIAAFVNAVCARAFDFEPVGPYVQGVSYPAHISGTTIPVALAVAEAVGASGREMFGAVALGEDVAARLVAASNFTLEVGWDNTGTTNAFGACAIAGRLLGLNKAQMQDAFGLVLNQLGGTLQSLYESVDSFKLCQGISAQTGITSALLARNSFTGPAKVLEGRHGYFRMYCQDWKEEKLLEGLGVSYHCDDVIKPYPCCRANHGAVDCALDVVSKAGTVDIRDVRGVKVYVRPIVARIFVNRPYGSGKVKQVDAAFNLRYCVSKALLKGKLGVQDFIEPELSDPQTKSLAEIVEVIPEDFPDGQTTAHIQVVLGNEILESSCKIPKGDRRYNPLSTSEIRQKFLNNVSLYLEDIEVAYSMLDLIERLDTVDNVRTFMDEMEKLLRKNLVSNLMGR